MDELLKKIVETVVHENGVPIEYQDGFTDGYAKAVADICAGLMTKRTTGGETITGAVHAADVIARGDFVGLSSAADAGAHHGNSAFEHFSKKGF